MLTQKGYTYFAQMVSYNISIELKITCNNIWANHNIFVCFLVIFILDLKATVICETLLYVTNLKPPKFLYLQSYIS